MMNERCPRCGRDVRDRAQGESCSGCLYEFGDGSVYGAWKKDKSRFGV